MVTKVLAICFCSKGMQVQQKPVLMKSAYISILACMVEWIKEVTLVTDVIFVSGLPFFVMLSQHIVFVTIQFVPCRTVSEMGMH